MMRVLFFLEPVIFRNSPSLISAHFQWVDYFRCACAQEGWHFALTANTSTCANWTALRPETVDAITLYEVNPFETLAAFDYERKNYAKAAYGQSEGNNPLFTRLAEIRELFRPTLVVMTSQNSFARHAFAGLPILSIEQAPLPRLGHPTRTAFDPSGHQTMSLLETQADRISSLPLTPQVRRQALSLLSAIKQTANVADARGVQVAAALEELRRENRVALLVTQPTDAVTYEGSYQPIELENLLYAWSEALPPGWIGVPTYHGGQQLTEEMEAALAAATPRLRFLPQTLSRGLSEPMLLVADGMVTISSTTAMTGLLFQKRVVVTGRSPYNKWCESDPAKIADAPTLNDDQVASILCFLTNRLALSHEVLDKNINPLIELMRAVSTAEDHMEWFSDTTEWTLEKAAGLFRFRGCVRNTDRSSQGCLREQLERQLGEATAQRNVFESEWKAAVADRDRVNQKLAELIFELDTVRAKFAENVSEKEGLLQEWRAAATDRDDLTKQIAILTEERDRARLEALAVTKKSETLSEELAETTAECDKMRAIEAALREDQQQLQQMFNAEVKRGNDLHAHNQKLCKDKDDVARELVHQGAENEKLHAALAADLDRLAHSLEETMLERDNALTKLTASSEERNRLDAELYAYIEWAKVYRQSIASLPLWRLALHYRNIAVDNDRLALPKEPGWDKS
ncbi:hypothetical protein F6X40_21050 [Paraburkholderia sp. UCT31]|uniref:hypothetical protein n=1 Tax=Paraburkholderia sp. UCT31 TaxID=2615209 RepID=UPI001655281B|nr:hypothetical protein [Paraburkholderia sp. UCT31]MBC8739239.1 hypothetical protein [Paraburkholderia sp. UCT31]